MRRIFSIVLLIAASWTSQAAAQDAAADADPFVAAVSAFHGGSYSDTEAFLQTLAATGDERALALMDQLEERELYVRDSDGALIVGVDGPERGSLIISDPVSGDELGTVSDDDFSDVRVNNRIRRALRAARGALTLMSEKPRTREEAAESVFASRDESVLETLREAIAREENARVLKAMHEAEAAIVLTQDDAGEADKLAAVEVVGDRGDRDALNLLTRVANDSESAVADAATAAADRVTRRLEGLQMVRNVWYGISLGSVLLLAATGLAITFGVMGVINMAHGELVMLGAYTTFVVQQLFMTYLPGLADFALIAAIPAAFLVSGGMGVAIERGVIRFLYGRPLETLLATWGISLILQQLVRSVFGPTNVPVSTPSWMTGTVEVVTGLDFTLNRIAIVVLTLIVFFGLQLVIRRTPFGLRMRAVTQNRRMANAVGIRSNWIDALTFGVGSGVAGIAGVALSQIDNVSPNLGQSYIIDSFLVVVFGGVGNLWGTLVGALTLGVANKFLEPMVGAVLGKIVILVAVILFIQRRPRGLFALRGRAVEA